MTPIGGLTAAILQDGTTVCGAIADAALDAHLRRGRHWREQHARESPPGLLMVHAYRQTASEFAGSSHVLTMSARHPMLARASLLIISANPALPTTSLLTWLSW